MRIAAAAVGSALVGTLVVLLSLPSRPGQVAQPTVGTARGAGEGALLPVAIRGTSSAMTGGCPCTPPPLDPAAWQLALSEADQETVGRALAMSLALRELETLAQALSGEAGPPRELAALLLNVASGRISTCVRLEPAGVTALAVVDALDRLLADEQAGREVPGPDLELVARAARALNQGEKPAEPCTPAPVQEARDGPLPPR